MVNKIWTKIIPVTNKVFLVLYLLLVFGLNLWIVTNDKSLEDFWQAMLVVLGIYCIFLFFDNKFKLDFSNSSSNLDQLILGIIILRNIIFLLNFIPLIQLLGLVGLIFGGPVLLVIYAIMIYYRYRQIKVI